MKRLVCISLVLVFLLPGCALHRKLFYSESEMAEYNAKEQAKKAQKEMKKQPLIKYLIFPQAMTSKNMVVNLLRLILPVA